MDVEVPQVKDLENAEEVKQKKKHHGSFAWGILDAIIEFFVMAFESYGEEIIKFIGGIIAVIAAVVLLMKFWFYIVIFAIILLIGFVIYLTSN